ncbi:uncharacterized protein M6B38_341725 [Iris pallida]|uniref:Uncharacterized protein n=1 Tax=Iris pallida TaxID=29817 RepID=A0AAX6GXN0_IRIPA|nr:uncharacterized protein M6B38_341725 [Iris pallida]
MAFSASKSASRRGNPERNVPGQLRSRSVSAFPTRNRSGADLPIPPEEFMIKRDNPLFCSSSASSSSSLSSLSSPPECETREEDWGRRGRSAARSSGVGSLGKSTRSLSRVDTGRRRLRSVSREPRGSFESDIENGYRSASSSRNKESGTSTHYRECKSEYDWKEQTKNLRTWTSQHPVSKSWDTSSRDHSVEDTGTDAIYETVRSEVRRAVSEIRNDLENAIQRENPAITTTDNIVDIPPELLNPDMVELVTEVRREYVTKLEQSQERARKLRADLAVERQREQELSRILGEIHQAPKSYGSRKCRPKRRASIERLRMSRDLAEEAMNYFDECVSISTFDSSEFSSLEDPQPGMPVGSSRFCQNEGSTFSGSNFGNRDTNHHEDLDNQTQCSLSSTGSELAIRSSCSSTKPAHIHVNNNHDDLGDYDKPRSENCQFSFAREPTEPAVINDDIRQYIKKFGKETRKERTESANARSTYNPEEYDLRSKAEILLLDRIILGNRMESGGLLVCDIRTF